MKQRQIFMTMLACMAFCACSNDDGVVQENNETFPSDKAYMNVRLADANSISRAADGGLEYGTVDEQTVKSAHFYFYDANKVFVTEGSAWNSGTASTGTPAENIEFKSNTVVVLKGLTKKDYPKYMVTVLNRPDNFKAGATLEEMEKTLSDKNNNGLWKTISSGGTTTKYFTMSTTSYKRTGDTPYFVTELTTENFSKEPVSTPANPVTVYVERLAAKVTLDVSSSLPKEANGMYKIKATVGGFDNAQATIAAEDLYINILGWKLNATAKHSNIVKNIDTGWTDALPFTSWNDAPNFRSYWGKSYNYGLTANSYPGSSMEITPGDYLDYVDLNSGELLQLKKSAYCAENTNTSEIVSADFASVVTSILVKAQVCDAEGNALQLVRYNGILYDKNSFLDYILDVLKTQNNLNYWTTTDNVKYNQIDRTYLKLVNISDGLIKVQFDNPLNTPIYAYDAITETFSITSDFAALDADLLATSKDAIGYTDGMMYYNIPIEHINNATPTATNVIPEGNYGVVRNHHYVVTINKLENIGKGIFDPDEKIIPQDKDKDTYYVGANINILSWKIVNQNVNL